MAFLPCMLLILHDATPLPSVKSVIRGRHGYPVISGRSIPPSHAYGSTAGGGFLYHILHVRFYPLRLPWRQSYLLLVVSGDWRRAARHRPNRRCKPRGCPLALSRRSFVVRSNGQKAWPLNLGHRNPCRRFQGQHIMPLEIIGSFVNGYQVLMQLFGSII